MNIFKDDNLHAGLARAAVYTALGTTALFGSIKFGSQIRDAIGVGLEIDVGEFWKPAPPTSYKPLYTNCRAAGKVMICKAAPKGP